MTWKAFGGKERKIESNKGAPSKEFNKIKRDKKFSKKQDANRDRRKNEEKRKDKI